MKQSVFLLVRDRDMLVIAVCSEKHGYTPDTGKCNYGINYPAEYRTAATEKPCNKVKAEKTHKTPVKATDYCE